MHTILSRIQRELDKAAHRETTFHRSLPQQFVHTYVAQNFLKKFREASNEKLLHAEALDRFKTVDTYVSEVNKRLSVITDVEGPLSRAKRKIARLLGNFNYREWFFSCGWGPGATFSLPASEAYLDMKYKEQKLSVTPGAFKYARAYLSACPAWLLARHITDSYVPCSPMHTEFQVVSSSRFTTVPKDRAKRRSIEIQPTMNLFLQKGVGSMIRRRLKRVGIDLDDQSRNRNLARLAMVSGLATLDLENASDTVSARLVEELLPRDWYSVMDDIRSKYIGLAGEDWKLSKFSSMGNGFTFELESLIFWAICSDIDDEVSVYGDDIIVRNVNYHDVVARLSSFGFVINQTKSFYKGVFYESCGFHSYCGLDVTPIYQKEDVESFSASIRLANRIFRLASRLSSQGLCVEFLRKPWMLAVQHCHAVHPNYLRRPDILGWEAEGDYGLLGYPTLKRRRNGIDQTLGYKLKPRQVLLDPEAAYAYSLMFGSLSHDSGGDPVRATSRLQSIECLRTHWY